MAAKIHFFIETTKQKKKKDLTGPEIRVIRVIRVRSSTPISCVFFEHESLVSNECRLGDAEAGDLRYG